MRHTHSWSIDGERDVLTTHLVMAPASSRDQIVQAKTSVRELLDAQAFEHVTIDMGLEGEEGSHRGARHPSPDH